ncbi:MAG: hypothetical protein JWO82_1593, partial [Akkermansiaceae bacterium]|nr:hypothetical protein [Akkermansiaceae bacterium]
ISVGDALLNLVLSIILAKTMGIAGVALGTLIATAAAGIFVVAPLTFSRLALSLKDFLVFQAKGTVKPLGLFLAILAVLLYFLPLHPSDSSLILLSQLAWRGALAAIPIGVLSWPVIKSMTH